MPSYNRYLLLRLVLVFAVVSLSYVLLVRQASAAPPPCVDLRITGIVIKPTNPAQAQLIAGQPANVAITITNAGSCAAGGFVTQFKTSPLSPVAVSGSISGLAAGASTTLNLPFAFPTAGNFRTVIQVNPAREVAETNYANDVEIDAVTVVPAVVNLQITHFAVYPVVPDPTGAVVEGRQAVAVITVKNTGNVAAGPFDVQWTPYLFALPLTHPVGGGLEPDHCETVVIEFTYPFAGTVTDTASIDSTTRFTPFDTATLETVVEPPLPNLRVQGVVVHAALAGSPSTIEATIENNGNVAAGHFVVSWKPGPSAATQSQQVNGLAEGGTKSLFFTYVFPTPGTFNGLITVDSTHQIHELFKNQNTAPTVVVVPAPTVDLTVTGLSIDPTEPVQGAPATVTVDVKNLGNSTSPSFVTDWNPDALGVSVPGLQTLAQETGPLGAGEERELTFSFAYPKPGNFRSIAEVNALKTVKETNYANNAKILDLTVVPAHIDLAFVGPITFNPNPMISKEKGTETVEIRNEGQIATGPFAVQLTPQAKGFAETKFLPGLNVHESATLTFPVTYSGAGTFTATAVIDPFNQVVKTVTPDEESSSVTVVPKSAHLKVKLSSVEDRANPGGWQEWQVILLGYQPKTPGCTITLKVEALGKSKEFKKTIKEVTCAEEENGLRHPFFNPGEKRATSPSVDVFLEEGQPLVAGTVALNICQGLTCLDIGLPGLTAWFESRAEYLHPFSGEKKVEGKKCEKELNEGNCYNAFFELSLVGHVGMNAVRASHAARSAFAASGAEPESLEEKVAKEEAAARAAAEREAAEAEAAAEAHAMSAVQQAGSELEEVTSQAKAYAAEVGAGPGGVSITATP